jgi:hypothetical protein
VVLAYLLSFLARLKDNAGATKMTSNNLAIIFAPLIMRPAAADVDQARRASFITTVVVFFTIIITIIGYATHKIVMQRLICRSCSRMLPTAPA